jgi:glucosamine--fructose-6-phosphate aminotransferase (isomerizing)
MPNPRVIHGPYLDDLLDQPRALRATWNLFNESAVFERIRSECSIDRFQRVVLTGMGSSNFGTIPLSMELARYGWTPVVLETSELIHSYPRLLTPSTLVIAVSQSGKSAEMVRLLELNGRRAVVIAVTNQADSPLAQQSDSVVLTAAGEEFSVSCKTYVAAQMALATLAAALCALDPTQRLRELEHLPDAVEEYLEGWEGHVGGFADLLRDTRDLFLVGRGPSLAAAGTGALIIKESAHFHAEGMSSATFRHGPFEMLQPGVTIGVFAGRPDVRPLHDRLIDDISRTPARVFSLSVDAELRCCQLPKTPDAAASVVEILPIQMMTLALAALSDREAGRFERASKVTVVE